MFCFSTSRNFFLTTFFLRWTGSSIHLLDLQLGQRDGPPSLRESHSYPHTWHLHSRVALFHAYEPQLGHLRGVPFLLFHTLPHLLHLSSMDDVPLSSPTRKALLQYGHRHTPPLGIARGNSSSSPSTSSGHASKVFQSSMSEWIMLDICSK